MLSWGIGAQGTTVQDVTIHATGALAGLAGGNGGGGTYAGVTVYGGLFGLDMRVYQAAAAVVAINLYNQTCAGIVFGSDLGRGGGGKAPLIATGLRIEGSPLLGGIVAGVGLDEFTEKKCLAGRVPRVNAKHIPPSNYLLDAASIVDSVVTVTGGAPCFIARSSLYASEVYTSGCDTIMSLYGYPSVHPPPGQGSTHLTLAAYGRHMEPDPTQAYEYKFPAYVNGSRVTRGVLKMTRGEPPIRFTERHIWSDGGVTWQDPNAVNVLDLGAKGDGIADDWEVLQNALDGHTVVVLPKGFYRLSKPLVMRQNGSALVGVGRTISILMTTHSGFGENPLLRVQRGVTDVTLGFVSLVTWDHSPAFALSWQGVGTFRQVFASRMNESTFPPFSALEHSPAGPTLPSTMYARALMVVSGGGAFYDLNLDFGCCFGTLLPSVPVPPAIASSSEILLQRGDYRTLLINGSTLGIRMYAHNTEQDVGDAHTEIRWSQNVTLYGAKSEGNYVAVWIRDSHDITCHGYGGDATPFANSTRYPEGRAQFMPTLFRVQRSTNVRLANLLDSGRITNASKPSVLVAAGNGTDPRHWNMVLSQDTDGICNSNTSPHKCSSTLVLDRPILWQTDPV